MSRAVRIVTWNFLSGGSARRNAHWSMLWNQLEPDVVLTQECRPLPEDFRCNTRLWCEAGPGRWGTGLYTADVAVKPIKVDGFAGWVTGGELDLAGCLSDRPVRIFSIHCPPGRSYVRTMHDILDRMRELARDADLVLGGDFNVAAGMRGPDEPVKMSKAERDLLDRFTAEFDLIPCWQTAHPGTPLAQTLRWTGNRTAPYHCDGIFVPGSWRDRLQSCEVITGGEWEGLSDHNPVMAVFATI